MIRMWMVRLVVGMFWCFPGATDGQAASPDQVAELRRMLRQANELAASDPWAADSMAGLGLQRSLPLEDDFLTAYAYYVLGKSNYFLGKHLLALNYYKRTLESPAAVRDDTLHAALLHNMAILYEFQGNLSEAVDHYHRSMLLSRRLADSVGVHQSFINIGFVCIGLERPVEAEEYLSEALRFFRSTQDVYHQALCLHNLAVLHATTKASDQAQDYFREARARYREAGREEQLFEMLLDQFYLLTAANELEKATPLLSELEQFGDLYRNPYVMATVSMAKGTFLYLSGHRFEEAERLFRDAETGFLGIKAYTKLTSLYEQMLDFYARVPDHGRQRKLMQEYQLLLRNKFNSETAQYIGELLALEKVGRLEQDAAALQRRFEGQRRLLAMLASLLYLAVAAWAYIRYPYRKGRKLAAPEAPDSSGLAGAASPVSRPTDADASDTALPGAVDVPSNGGDTRDQHHAALYREVTAHIEGKRRYLDPSLKIKDIAFELGTNEKYISLCISRFGKSSFIHYVANLRVEEAKRLLVKDFQRPVSIKEVAVQSGFSNQPQFQRKFKEITGMTPGEFRQAHGLG